MYCRHCGKELPEDARFCTFCGTRIGENEPERKDAEKAPEAQESGKRRSGCGCFAVLLLVCVILGVALVAFSKANESSRRRSSSPSYSYSSSSTYNSSGSSANSGYRTGSSSGSGKTNTTPQATPGTWEFADDAEAVVDSVKEAFAQRDVKVTWLCSGYKLLVTLKVNNISGDELRNMYWEDAEGAQATIDQLGEAMRSANSGAWQSLKDNGHTGCTVIFSMVSSDGLEMVTAENGKISYSVKASNFRYG